MYHAIERSDLREINVFTAQRAGIDAINFKCHWNWHVQQDSSTHSWKIPKDKINELTKISVNSSQVSTEKHVIGKYRYHV